MRANNILCCSAVAFVNNGLSNYGIRGQQCHQKLGNNRKQPQIISLFDGCDGIDDDNMKSFLGDCGDIGDSMIPKQYTQRRWAAVAMKSQDKDAIPQQHTPQRRMAVQIISHSIISSILLMNANAVQAACLPGDVRADCIGVYKVPIDAMSESDMSPDKLKLYAPDLNWVEPVQYPKTYDDAISQLNDLRQQLDDAQDLVAKGDMEASGISLLEIIPKTNAAGITIIQTINKALIDERNNAMKSKKRKDGEYVENPSTNKGTILEIEASRVQTSLNELLGYLGEIDVLLGQGLRGALGAPAPAQIQILENFAECKREFDNFLATIPKKPR